MQTRGVTELEEVNKELEEANKELEEARKAAERRQARLKAEVEKKKTDAAQSEALLSP